MGELSPWCELLAGYIEKYGTGTLMIWESIEHALPEPDFAQLTDRLHICN